jgi:hypothetical protein
VAPLADRVVDQLDSLVAPAPVASGPTSGGLVGRVADDQRPQARRRTALELVGDVRWTMKRLARCSSGRCSGSGRTAATFAGLLEVGRTA